MGGVEFGKLGSGGEDPGGICKIASLYGLFRNDNVAIEGVAACPVRQPWGWDPLCTTGGHVEGFSITRTYSIQEGEGY